MKIAFFGTAKFAAIILQKIIRSVNESASQWKIVGVVTRPDKPSGRKQIVSPSPVKILAQKHKIAVFTPENLTSNFQLPTSNLSILAAYGKIILPWLLKKPKYGFLNIHPSLLPKYRGASPVQFALLNGENKTGVTIIQMDEEMDHGPIITQENLTIAPNDTSESLTEKLAYLGGKLLGELLTSYITHGRPHSQFMQDHTKATFTRLLKKENGFLAFETLKKILKGEEIAFEECPPFIQKETKKNNLTMRQFNNKMLHNFIRALYPWPSAWTILPSKKRLKLLKSHLKNGKVILDEVQIEGRKPSFDSKFLYDFF